MTRVFNNGVSSRGGAQGCLACRAKPSPLDAVHMSSLPYCVKEGTPPAASTAIPDQPKVSRSPSWLPLTPPLNRAQITIHPPTAAAWAVKSAAAGSGPPKVEAALTVMARCAPPFLLHPLSLSLVSGNIEQDVKLVNTSLPFFLSLSVADPPPPLMVPAAGSPTAAGGRPAPSAAPSTAQRGCTSLTAGGECRCQRPPQQQQRQGGLG